MKQNKKLNETIIVDGFTIVPGLDEKYADDPFFLEKARQADEFLKKHGLPKELTRDKPIQEQNRTK